MFLNSLEHSLYTGLYIDLLQVDLSYLYASFLVLVFSLLLLFFMCERSVPPKPNIKKLDCQTCPIWSCLVKRARCERFLQFWLISFMRIELQFDWYSITMYYIRYFNKSKVFQQNSKVSFYISCKYVIYRRLVAK